MPEQSDDPEAKDIPAFRFAEKKVDDSWKEEVRREREAAARALSGAKSAAAPTAAPAQSAESAPPQPDEPKPAESKLSAQEQQQSRIFMTLITGLAQQALMQLGAMPNPHTG